MAYIPDDAVDNMAEVSPSAFLAYALICRRRNHQRQAAYFTIELLSTAMSVGKSTAYAAVSDLERAEWLTRSENSWYPLKGSFHPVDKRYLDKRGGL